MGRYGAIDVGQSGDPAGSGDAVGSRDPAGSGDPVGSGDAVGLGLGWLVDTDVRHADGAEIGLGGLNQGYNWRERSYPFVYSEITGYAVSIFANAYRWTGDEGYVRLARQAADYVLGVQGLVEEEVDRGAIPHSLSLPGLRARHEYYSFDAAMCLQGLLDLYSIRPAPELRRAAQAIGDWLVERMQREDGAFLAMVDAGAGGRVESGEWRMESGEWRMENGEAGEWERADGRRRADGGRRGDDDPFGDGGCLHAKHAIGLLKLSRVTGDDGYAAAARRVCDWVLGLQDEDGAFRATERLRQVVSHPHCYATEGLLFAHDVLGRGRYLEAARRAGEWLLGAQNRDGSIRIAYKRRWWRMGRRVIEKFNPRRVSDATAQAIRIWLTLYYLDGDRRFLDGCHRAAGFLHRMQCITSSDRNAVGGVYFWPGHAMMFTWCTMFAVGALYALEHVDREDGYQRMIAELF